MYICICNAVTDGQIKTCVDQGAKTIRDLNQTFPIGDQCGKCIVVTKAVINTQIGLKTKK